MDIKALWNKYGVMVIFIAAITYGQFQMVQKQNEYLMDQVDILQDKVAVLQTQVAELNDNVQWLRSRW